MFDITSALIWFTLGGGSFGLALAEYKISRKKRAIKAEI